MEFKEIKCKNCVFSVDMVQPVEKEPPFMMFCYYDPKLVHRPENTLCHNFISKNSGLGFNDLIMKEIKDGQESQGQPQSES